MSLWHDMKTRWDKTLASQPRWDGNRFTFFINTEGKADSTRDFPPAFQDLFGRTHLAMGDLLGRFMDSREKIEETVARIFHITPEWVSGPVTHMGRRHRPSAAG